MGGRDIGTNIFCIKILAQGLKPLQYQLSHFWIFWNMTSCQINISQTLSSSSWNLFWMLLETLFGYKTSFPWTAFPREILFCFVGTVVDPKYWVSRFPLWEIMSNYWREKLSGIQSGKFCLGKTENKYYKFWS